MSDSLLKLSFAVGVHTSDCGLPFLPFNLGFTNGTFLRKFKGLLLPGSNVRYDLNDFRDHISCALNDDSIPDSNVLSIYLVLIMKGCSSDNRSANFDSRYDRNGSECTGSSYLY